MAKHKSNWNKPGRGNRHERGYGHKWNRLRELVLARDRRLCVMCAELGKTETATTVDHIRPKSRGGTDVSDNLQSLCKACHLMKTAKESSGQPLPGTMKDGVPIAKNHHWNTDRE